MSPAGQNFRILFVCTGNVCRSPFAQFFTQSILKARLRPQDGDRFIVGSAGIEAVTGARIDVLAHAELARRGLAGSAAEFRARQLQPQTAEAADLVLTADRDHRSAVVRMTPSALRRTFCIREFARHTDDIPTVSLPADPVDRARHLVSLAAQRRGAISYAAESEDTIPDPRGRSAAVHRSMADTIAEAMNSFVVALATSAADASARKSV